MTKYVLGFLFDELGNVALIQKKRPSWQKGYLNGIGGHIEKGESPLAGMQREFGEEAYMPGAPIPEWRQFLLLKGRNPDFRIHCFRSVSDTAITSKTDEPVDWYPISSLLELRALPNLRWLIPLALYGHDVRGELREW